MLDVGTVETPEDVFCFCGPEPEGRGVLDQLIVLLGDQFPIDGPGENRGELRVGTVLSGR